ncbi:hypothetical protein [Deinococcus yavapaiensis]|uniref:Uncharacterized protein n=1 Tax=Deinococcus yavapaiensis KR-236 TaxID=694435 RepID=A0A318SAU8_9DEIO|nr:hypothetical protein [Deinococcus yavapaiensis]PYE55692.1 hypothetical protein DES52_10255 [Deinococcus yavapaiensis KR-236]
MKGSVRYIITRPCLSEGSVRLLKYLEAVFPLDGSVTLLDDRGQEYAARVDRKQGRVYGLRDLYSAHNLGVNDVLLVTPLAEARYQVECVVKPLQERSVTSARPRPPEPPQRVVVSESPYVREVRFERRSTPDVTAEPAPRATERPAPIASPVAVPAAVAVAPVAVAPRPLERSEESTASAGSPEDLLREFASLVGYRFEWRAPNLARLRAELGAQGYTVLIATASDITTTPAWQEDAEYRALLVPEGERTVGARLTHEALVSLVESARLAPLTPLELRGYWNTGNFDLESAASVAELVSAQLSARGVFSFVLMTLSQHPAHSVVSSARLAERLGSGVNGAELARVLDTLSAPPFAALSPLGGGQYYLRADIPDVLRSLCDYADGLRTRINAEARVAALAR